jgi:hypothetical protein
MKFGSRLATLLFVLLAPLLLTAFCQDAQSPTGYSLAEARKVLAYIDTIEAETQRPWSGPLRSVSVSESEFNSYIAYRIETEKEEIMKELRLKILADNKIEGKIHIDLRGQDVPRFVKPEMDVYFAADVMTQNGQAKVDMKEIFLGDEPIKPMILDLVIAVSARLNNQKATSINDWYALPYGIKEIKTEKGRATFFY